MRKYLKLNKGITETKELVDMIQNLTPFNEVSVYCSKKEQGFVIELNDVFVSNKDIMNIEEIAGEKMISGMDYLELKNLVKLNTDTLEVEDEKELIPWNPMSIFG